MKFTDKLRAKIQRAMYENRINAKAVSSEYMQGVIKGFNTVLDILDVMDESIEEDTHDAAHAYASEHEHISDEPITEAYDALYWAFLAGAEFNNESLRVLGKIRVEQDLDDAAEQSYKIWKTKSC